MNKKVILPAILLGLAAAGVLVFKTGVVSAAFGESGGPDQMAKELATKLNVSEEQVSKALDEIRVSHQEERKAEVSTSLDKAVADGVITAEQKQKVLDKMAANQAEKQAEKAERKQNREEMEQWFKDNGIDGEKLRSYIGGPRHGKDNN
jgi:gamma-glutamyltranspeptidase